MCERCCGSAHDVHAVAGVDARDAPAVLRAHTTRRRRRRRPPGWIPGRRNRAAARSRAARRRAATRASDVLPSRRAYSLSHTTPCASDREPGNRSAQREPAFVVAPVAKPAQHVRAARSDDQRAVGRERDPPRRPDAAAAGRPGNAARASSCGGLASRASRADGSRPAVRGRRARRDPSRCGDRRCRRSWSCRNHATATVPASALTSTNCASFGGRTVATMRGPSLSTTSSASFPATASRPVAPSNTTRSRASFRAGRRGREHEACAVRCRRRAS